MTGRPAVLGGDALFPERLPLVRPTLEDIPDVGKRIEGILASGTLTNGPTVRELEDAVADRLGKGTHVVGVASCTAGLMLVYQALGAGRDTRVILPSFTFAASAHAAVWAGAEVDFADVTPERCSLDVGDAASRMEADGPPVSAISATHLYGHPAEVEALEALAREHGVPVVFDAAHALGSVRGDRPVGTFGTAEVFSLSPTKVVVAGEGGLVTTRDASLAEALRIGRDYGNPSTYDCAFPGVNARLSELHAAVALASLARLDEHVERRNELVDRFAAGVDGLQGLRVVRGAPGDTSTYKDLTVVLDPPDCGLGGAVLQAALDAEGIDSRRYYHPPIHRQRAYGGWQGARRALPVTDDLAGTVLTPPLWSHMGDDQLDRVILAVRRILDHGPEVAEALAPAAGGSS